MQKNQARKKAKELFLQGMSVDRIAKKLKIKGQNVYNWARRYGWNPERDQIQKKVDQQVAETILEKMTKKLVENTDQHLDISRLACRIALETLVEAFKTRPQNILDTCERCVKIAASSSAVQKSVIPQAQEEVIKKAMEELEKIKREQSLLRQGICSIPELESKEAEPC